MLDIDAQCVSVSDYQWREPRWGIHRYKSFTEAIKGAMSDAIERCETDAAKQLKLYQTNSKFAKIIRKAITKLPTILILLSIAATPRFDTQPRPPLFPAGKEQ